MTSSIRASLLAALLVVGATPLMAQMDAEAMLRTALRSGMSDSEVDRRFQFRSETLYEQAGVDLTTSYAVPRTPSSAPRALFQVTFRNISGPGLCGRFKVIYDDDAYHEPQFLRFPRDNVWIPTGSHIGLVAVWATPNGMRFSVPQWRLGFHLWEPAPSGERRCDAAAPRDLNEWINSEYTTYGEFRNARP
jgi:hypothetical protein